MNKCVISRINGRQCGDYIKVTLFANIIQLRLDCG